MTDNLYSAEKINFLIENFENRTLSKLDWTHESHLTVAVWHIHNYEFFEAVCRLKSGIILLNAAHKTENTSTTGYHETLTIFWSKILHLFINLNKGLSLEAITNKLLQSSLADKNFPFKFYIKSELLSAEARSIYIEPTLLKIEEDVINQLIQTGK